jgi:SpoIIAA-like
MVERIDTPERTLGFRASGRLEASDYRETILPPIAEVLKADGELRIVFCLDDDFEVHDGRAIWEDLKVDFDIGVHHRDNLKRSALVTDIDWIKRWARMFGWISPGDLKVFPPSELDAAKDWAAG